jgi:hypothetical protein
VSWWFGPKSASIGVICGFSLPIEFGSASDAPFVVDGLRAPP